MLLEGGIRHNLIMGFNSYAFIFFFLPLIWMLYRLAAKNNGSAVLFLIGASLIFYAWHDPYLIVLLAFSLFINYAVAIKISSASANSGNASNRFFITGLIVNIALLSLFRLNAPSSYQTAFASSIYAGYPLALSFLAFQQIVFLSEIKNGNEERPSFLNYCLYMTFFPQLLAGPIVKPGYFFKQLLKDDFINVNWHYIPAGVTLFSLGLFKKTALADPVARFADSAFNAAQAGAMLTAAEAWSGALSFSFQIYFDLSGYADMALGIALLFGVQLPWNFDSPYKAESLIEFWRRWHMTLAQFAKDYIYAPLGGGKKGPMRQTFCLLAVMILTGLWHGAGLTFLAWGALHGLFLSINHLWRRFKPGLASRSQPVWKTWTKRAATFLVLTALWAVFRADSLATAASIWKSMAGLQNEVARGFNNVKIGEDRLWFLALVIWLAPNSREWMSRIFSDERFDSEKTAIQETRWASKFKWSPNEYWAAFSALLFIISVLQLPSGRAFIYFQF